MRTVKCSNCGADARIVRGEYNLTGMGMPAVVENIAKIECKRCRNVDPVIPNLNDLMRVIAGAIVCKPCKLNGADVRFLRKYLGKTAQEFGKLLNVDKTTVSKWENGHDPIGDQSDRLIRLIAIALGDSLRNKLPEVVQALPQIRNTCRHMNIHVDHDRMSYEYA